VNFLKRFWDWFSSKKLREAYREELTKFEELNTKIFELPRREQSRKNNVLMSGRKIEQLKEQIERERWFPKPSKPFRPRTKKRIPRKGSSNLASLDVGKFFKGKGKGQHKFYRRSVLERVQPEED